jgi:putative oxidoreductase
MVPLSGAMLLAGGLLIAIGLWPDLGALLLAAFLLPVAYYMHAYWKIDEIAALDDKRALMGLELS